MLQEKSLESQTSEFYVSYMRNGAVEITKVLIGESIGVASEKPGEIVKTLTNPKNPLPEGMYVGTLEELLTYMSTDPSPEEPTLKRFLEKIRRSLQSLFS